jgi:hypothetical protein
MRRRQCAFYEMTIFSTRNKFKICALLLWQVLLSTIHITIFIEIFIANFLSTPQIKV